MKNMIKKLQELIKKYENIIITALFSGAFLFHSLEITRGVALFMTPFLLLFVSCYLIWVFIKDQPFMDWALLFCCFIYLSTFTIEAVGVNTGLVFGNYIYGSVFGQKLFGTSLLIGLNWVLVVLSTTIIARRFFSIFSLSEKKKDMWKNRIIIATGAGLFAVFLDLLLEPVAIALDYWTWGGDGTIPLKNYIAWFVITFVLSFLTQVFFREYEEESFVKVYVYQIIFFAGMNVLILAGLV